MVAKGGEATSNKGSGDNPAIALLTVLGNTPPPKVVINEMTTVASVWTNAQFLDGTAIKGPALGLRIAAGNVPNFVDLATGSYGTTIRDGLNSGQTPTMANFATLSSVLAGCATQIKADACNSLFAAANAPDGKVPTDTLAAAEFIARAPWHQPEKVFALLENFYPVPEGKPMLRPTPFMPYLSFAPSAWPRWRRGGDASAPPPQGLLIPVSMRSALDATRHIAAEHNKGRRLYVATESRRAKAGHLGHGRDRQRGHARGSQSLPQCVPARQPQFPERFRRYASTSKRETPTTTRCTSMAVRRRRYFFCR